MEDNTIDGPSIRSARIYGVIVGCTVLIALVGGWPGVSFHSVATIFLAGAVLFTGMPHGAVDHLVAAGLYTGDWTGKEQAMFYGGYLGLAVLYGAFWMVAPRGSLGVFLLLTMYHFGQADLAYWRLPPLWARLVYLSRGLFLLGAPIAAFPAQVDPIFGAIAGVQVSSWPLVGTEPDLVFIGLIGQHVLLLGMTSLFSRIPWTAMGREFVTVGVLTALFSAVHPLVAFAVYFCLWHSVSHILELLRYFRARRSSPASLSAFYREAALFTVLPFVGLFGLYWATHAFASTTQMIALLFIIIAVLTLPHMIIVEAMYRQRERRDWRAPDPN